jgi:hypothetical protein
MLVNLWAKLVPNFKKSSILLCRLQMVLEDKVFKLTWLTIQLIRLFNDENYLYFVQLFF